MRIFFTILSTVLCTAISMLALTSPASAKTIQYPNVHSLSELKTIMAKQTTPGDVLVVFDIDDTLLESNSFVGGDTWYNWQRGKEIENTDGGTTTIDKADKFACIFSKLGLLYEVGGYHATENNAADIVNDLQKKYDVLAITSRSPDYRGGTHRELSNAGFHFEDSHLLPEGEALAYQLNDGKSTRGVTYQGGVVMSTGLNKGVVLEDLLKRLKRTYQTLFFVDDGSKNITNMANAFKDRSEMMVTLHYTGVDKTISDADITQSQQARAALNKFLKIAFPNRALAFESGNCN